MFEVEIFDLPKSDVENAAKIIIKTQMAEGISSLCNLFCMTGDPHHFFFSREVFLKLEPRAFNRVFKNINRETSNSRLALFFCLVVYYSAEATVL